MGLIGAIFLTACESFVDSEVRMGYVSAQIASGTLEVAAESGAKVADAVGGPVAQAVFKTDGAPSESGGPPAWLQVFIGTLGLFAVPVVACSLYTLNTTGAPRSPLYSIKTAGWTRGAKTGNSKVQWLT